MQVGICYYTILAHSTLALSRFFGEDVAAKSFLVSNFTTTGNFKALLCATVGFNLWHYITFFSYSLLASRTVGNFWSLTGNVSEKFRSAKVTVYRQNSINKIKYFVRMHLAHYRAFAPLFAITPAHALPQGFTGVTATIGRIVLAVNPIHALLAETT